VAQAEAGQGHGAGIMGEPDSSGAVLAVLDAVDHEAVQVLVGPPEGELEDGVELGDGGLVGDEQPPPDQRADLRQHHPELEHGGGRPGCGLRPGHGTPGKVGARRAVRSRSAAPAGILAQQTHRLWAACGAQDAKRLITGVSAPPTIRPGFGQWYLHRTEPSR